MMPRYLVWFWLQDGMEKRVLEFDDKESAEYWSDVLASSPKKYTRIEVVEITYTKLKTWTVEKQNVG